MEDIYLIPIRLKPLNFTIQNIYLKDIYYIYPKEYEEKIGNICIITYKEKDSNYDVIHIGEVIDKIKEKLSTAHITFLKTDDVVIFFNENKKDRTKYLRVLLVSIVVLMGSIMGIMNFHADVNMIHSQSTMVNALTKNPKKYLPYFQIPYSIGIGVGVALFFNKFIPTYAKNEPSPLDLKMKSLNKEIEPHTYLNAFINYTSIYYVYIWYNNDYQKLQDIRKNYLYIIRYAKGINIEAQANAYWGLGDLYKVLEQKKAMKYFLKARKILIQIGNTYALKALDAIIDSLN